MKEETVTVKRQTNFGEYDSDGFPVAPMFTTFTIQASIQPLSGWEILQVPEGDRTRQLLNVFTETQEIQHKDIVVRNGAEYEAQVPEDWTIPGVNVSYWKVRIARIDVER